MYFVHFRINYIFYIARTSLLPFIISKAYIKQYNRYIDIYYIDIIGLSLRAFTLDLYQTTLNILKSKVTNNITTS